MKHPTGPLARALLVSALVHVLLLAGTTETPGHASLARPERLAVVVSATRPAAAPPASAGGLPRGGRPVAGTEVAPAPLVRSTAAPDPVLLPSPSPPPPAVAGAPQPLVAPAAGESRVAAPVAAPPLPEAGHAADRPRPDGVAPVAESEELRAFRIALAAGAAAHREYPPMARERGWQGVVGVRVNFLPGRDAPEVTVSKSSGVPTLDQSALRMMRRAAEAVAVPGNLRGRAVRLEMPVDYRLED